MSKFSLANLFTLVVMGSVLLTPWRIAYGSYFSSSTAIDDIVVEKGSAITDVTLPAATRQIPGAIISYSVSSNLPNGLMFTEGTPEDPEITQKHRGIQFSCRRDFQIPTLFYRGACQFARPLQKCPKKPKIEWLCPKTQKLLIFSRSLHSTPNQRYECLNGIPRECYVSRRIGLRV